MGENPSRDRYGEVVSTGEQQSSSNSPLNQHRAVPGQDLSNPRKAHEKGKLGKIPRHKATDHKGLVFTDRSKRCTDRRRKQINERGELPGTPDDPVVYSMAAASAEIVKRTELVASPRGQPVGPAKVEFAARLEHLRNGGE